MSMFCCGRLLNDLSSPLQKFLHKCQTLKRSVWDVASYFPPAWVPFDLFPFPEPVTDYSKWNMSVPVMLLVSFLQPSGLLHEPVQKSHSFVNIAVWLLSCELQWVKCKCIWGLSLSCLHWSLVLYLLFVLEHFSSLPSVSCGSALLANCSTAACLPASPSLFFSSFPGSPSQVMHLIFLMTNSLEFFLCC